MLNVLYITLVGLIGFTTGSHHHTRVDSIFVSGRPIGSIGEKTFLEIRGSGYTTDLKIGLTQTAGENEEPCQNLRSPLLVPDVISPTRAKFALPEMLIASIPKCGETRLWICGRSRPSASEGRIRHKQRWIYIGPVSNFTLMQSQKDSASCELSLKNNKQQAPTVRLSTPAPYSETGGAGDAFHAEAAAAFSTVDSGDKTKPEALLFNDIRENMGHLRNKDGIFKRSVANSPIARESSTQSTVLVKESVTGNRRTNLDAAVDGEEKKSGVLNQTNSFESVTSDRGGSSAEDSDKRKFLVLPLESADRQEDLLTPETPLDANSTFHSSNIRVTSLRVESHDKGLDYDDLAGNILADTNAEVRFFGVGFTESTEFLFTSYEADYGTPCGAHTTKAFKIKDLGDDWVTATIQLPLMTGNQTKWYLCAREGPEERAYHQGQDPWLTMKSYNIFLPLWLQIFFIVTLLCLSGLFSGLNLGLMALDMTDLKIVSNTGSPIEQRHARAIEPVRKHGNYLLCTLLLGNVLVNSSLTILLDSLSTGLIAVIGSTLGIVIFGEIIPQAICSRHGLAVGARTVWLVRIFMVVTGPMSFPISKLLDFVLGEEIGNTYNRERLKELIRLTQDKTDLKREEQNIICGALEFYKKTVGEVMTKLDDVYMLSIDAHLDFNTINTMMQQGYSRIPVYETKRTNIVSVLFIKDLAFIDPDDNTPLNTLCQFYQNPLNFVNEDMTLDVMMKDFKEGCKGHMAFVQKVISKEDCDPFYEVVGLVTLEDVIEELIQEEIVDETDVFTDNRKKRRRQIAGRRDFTEFSQTGSQTITKKIQISSQMQVAALQYLRTSVEPFKEGYLSEGVVKKLVNQDVFHSIKSASNESKADQQTYIYNQGKPADYFVLILEGHVEVLIGKEGLTFENGPFTTFGLAALPLDHPTALGDSPLLTTRLSRGSIRSIQSLDATKSAFVPDYSVRAISEVLYMKISCSHYVAARRAYFLEKSQKEEEENLDQNRQEILNEDEFPFPTPTNSEEQSVKEKTEILNMSPAPAFNSLTSLDINRQISSSPTAKNIRNSALTAEARNSKANKVQGSLSSVNTINVTSALQEDSESTKE